MNQVGRAPLGPPNIAVHSSPQGHPAEISRNKIGDGSPHRWRWRDRHQGIISLDPHWYEVCCCVIACGELHGWAGPYEL